MYCWPEDDPAKVATCCHIKDAALIVVLTAIYFSCYAV